MKTNRLRLYPLAFFCAVLMSACGGSSSGGGKEDTGVKTAQGVFLDSAVEGLSYQSGDIVGTTDSEGTFSYEVGKFVTFKVGGIVIGSAIGAGTLTPLSLVADASSEADPHVVNIARFLQTIDNDGNPDNGITITETLRSQAQALTVTFNKSTNDFSNDTSVQNILAQLTDLTDAGQRGLVSGEDALAHLQKILNGGIGLSDYCAQNTPVSTSNNGNVYRFDANTGKCFGIVKDSSLRKSVAFSMREITTRDGIASPQFSAQDSIRLYLRKEGINLQGFDLNAAVNLTNDSDGYYCYRDRDVEFKDAEGNVLIENVTRGSNSGGALYHSAFNTKRTCIPAGSTHTYIASAKNVSVDVFNRIKTASMPKIELRQLSSGYQNAKVMNAQAKWLHSESGAGLNYPSFSVTWENTTGGKLKLDDNAHSVWFFDKDGYALSSSYVRLEEALGKEKEDLKDEDYLIDAGESFTLIDEIADNAAVSPSKSTSARVYLEWVPVVEN